MLSGNNDPNGAGDLQEGFEFGYEAPEGEERDPAADGVLAGANIWPTQLPEFRVAALEY